MAPQEGAGPTASSSVSLCFQIQVDVNVLLLQKLAYVSSRMCTSLLKINFSLEIFLTGPLSTLKTW